MPPRWHALSIAVSNSGLHRVTDVPQYRPFRNARGKLFDMADRGDHLEILRQRTDLEVTGIRESE
ncbi:hypothetical protein [Pelagicoccus sp. SDUM812003]|uniref:hypothetical protein n=1 Tax=Pelagicoccus sp. SDUM812003 TaxID=3041267 RepID=UPI00280E8C89|nr:hypothetical protein [Pelagicoccus sp. SDUM812003]MDQ8205676.1 hypothetical protein [Pelagicoccus sp. SDUM812003]